MGRKKAHTPEEIVAKLRQVEVLAAQGVGLPTDTATEIDLDGPVEGYAAFGTSVTS